MATITLQNKIYTIVKRQGIADVGMEHPNTADAMASLNVPVRLILVPFGEKPNRKNTFMAYVKRNGDVSPNLGGDPKIGTYIL